MGDFNLAPKNELKILEALGEWKHLTRLDFDSGLVHEENQKKFLEVLQAMEGLNEVRFWSGFSILDKERFTTLCKPKTVHFMV